MAACETIINPRDSIYTTMCIYAKGTSGLEVRVEIASPAHMGSGNCNWVMWIERQQTNGSWLEGGRRTGYTSDLSPSSRTFTNVKRGRWRATVRFSDVQSQDTVGGYEREIFTVL